MTFGHTPEKSVRRLNGHERHFRCSQVRDLGLKIPIVLGKKRERIPRMKYWWSAVAGLVDVDVFLEDWYLPKVFVCIPPLLLEVRQ